MQIPSPFSLQWNWSLAQQFVERGYIGLEQLQMSIRGKKNILAVTYLLSCQVHTGLLKMSLPSFLLTPWDSLVKEGWNTLYHIHQTWLCSTIVRSKTPEKNWCDPAEHHSNISNTEKARKHTESWKANSFLLLWWI